VKGGGSKKSRSGADFLTAGEHRENLTSFGVPGRLPFDDETNCPANVAMRALAAGLTDVGLQRDHNEDSFAIASEFSLYIVADGMGGHRAGDVASKMATESITDFFRQTSREDATWPFHFDTNLSEEENRLVSGIRLANRQIFDKGIRSRDHSGMGTTVVGALFSKRKNRQLRWNGQRPITDRDVLGFEVLELIAHRDLA